MYSAVDHQLMSEALAQAQKALYLSNPNPRVGCVIVKEEQVDLLIIGAHGHTGIKDFIYGTTINAVRHELRIPVLIVNV
jgi:nucleotide-binding universal stress UspA family protein